MMSFRVFTRLTFFICIFLSACENKITTPPIPTEKMVSILCDINIAEAYSIEIARMDTSKTNRQTKNYDSLANFYSDILAHHQVTVPTFLEAMNYYKKYPDSLKNTLDKVLPELSKLEAESAGMKK